jgi:hypothetical protein
MQPKKKWKFSTHNQLIEITQHGNFTNMFQTWKLKNINLVGLEIEHIQL